MRKLIYVVAASTGLAIAAPVAFADEVQLDDLPDKVRTAADRKVGDGEIREIDRDRENGKTVYEIEYVEAGQKKAVVLDEKGRVIDTHRD